MKTLIYVILCCVAVVPATAQLKVGANPSTISSGAILQADASGTRGAFYLPRVTLTGTADITTVATPQAGFTVYNTATAGTAPNNVTPGYYYYDGTQWQKILASSSGSSTNIYTADGTLTGNRTVTQGANALAFTSSAVNGFSVDGTTFSVDAANNRVGVGTAAPATGFHVLSTVANANNYSLFEAPVANIDFPVVTLRNSNALATGNTSLIAFIANGPGSGGASWGLGSIRTSPVTGVLNEDFTIRCSNGGAFMERLRITNLGALGFGTATPQGVFTIDANRDDAVSPTTGQQDNDFTILQTGNTGIGTTVPTEKLDVTGNIKFSGALMPNNMAGTSGQVLISAGTGASPVWTSNATSNEWHTTGNIATTPGINFIGTTDDKDLVFKRNGVQAGLLNSVLQNTSFGVNGLNPATTGAYNTAVGAGVLISNTNGTQNMAIGSGTLYNNTSGSFNSATGINTMTNNTTGNNNTASGNLALYSNSTGSSNTAIGYNAANNLNTGSNNLAVGANTNFTSATGSNQMNIANNIFGTGLNGSVGSPAGNIGIGTAAPSTTLDVNGNARIRNTTNAAVGTVVKPLYTDATGNVVLSPDTYLTVTAGTKTTFNLGALAAGATSAVNNFDVSGFGASKIYVRTWNGSSQQSITEILCSYNNNTAQISLRIISTTFDVIPGTTDAYVYGVGTAHVSWAGAADGTGSPNFTITGVCGPPGSSLSITNKSNVAYSGCRVYIEKLF